MPSDKTYAWTEKKWPLWPWPRPQTSFHPASFVVFWQLLFIFSIMSLWLWPNEVCSLFNSKGDNLKMSKFEPQLLLTSGYFSNRFFIFFVMTSFSNYFNRFLPKVTRKSLFLDLYVLLFLSCVPCTKMYIILFRPIQDCLCVFLNMLKE